MREHHSRLKQEPEVVRISHVTSGAAKTHIPGVEKFQGSRGGVAKN